MEWNPEIRTLCARNQFIYPTVYRPDRIMTAAAFLGGSKDMTKSRLWKGNRVEDGAQRRLDTETVRRAKVAAASCAFLRDAKVGKPRKG